MTSKLTLNEWLQGALFEIPVYQRGFAWDAPQIDDFIRDIDAIVAEGDNVRSHYMGTIVTYLDKAKPQKYYGIRTFLVKDVVDGQQRLTSILLFLSVLLKALSSTNAAFDEEKRNLLVNGGTPRLRLNGNDGDFFTSLLNEGGKTTGQFTNPDTPQKKRLKAAADAFDSYINRTYCFGKREPLSCSEEKRRRLFSAVMSKLVFSCYEIEEECEIGMTFELMNARGKGLSVLELLKNYFLYWVSRNLAGESDERKSRRHALTEKINKNFAEVYRLLGMLTDADKQDQQEQQCLRIAWTLFINAQPKEWKGYIGFKEDSCIPIRNFAIRSLEKTEGLLQTFVDGLVIVTRAFVGILVTKDDKATFEEKSTLEDILHTGNTANAMPLLVAVKIRRERGEIDESAFIDIATAVERYSFRTYLWAQKRSDAGIARLYSLAKECFDGAKSPAAIVAEINSLTEYHSPTMSFENEVRNLRDWYGRYRLTRCVLFAYEKKLAGGRPIRISWENTSDRKKTIEHILPQTPKEGSHWLEVWPQASIAESGNDIGNLILTENNSNYLNFEYSRKRLGADNDGTHPNGVCYRNSAIWQEREIGDQYDTWTPDDARRRREQIVAWILKRWSLPLGTAASVEEDEGDDTEEV